MNETTSRRHIKTLKVGEGLSEEAIREGYQHFKAEKNSQELRAMAEKYGLQSATLQSFVTDILQRMIFDGEHLTDLLGPLELGWKARRDMELALMADLVPLLKERSKDAKFQV